MSLFQLRDSMNVLVADQFSPRCGLRDGVEETKRDGAKEGPESEEIPEAASSL
jgi:hypothetical protein